MSAYLCSSHPSEQRDVTPAYRVATGIGTLLSSNEGNNRVGQVPPHIWAHFRKDRNGGGEFRDVSGRVLAERPGHNRGPVYDNQQSANGRIGKELTPGLYWKE